MFSKNIKNIEKNSPMIQTLAFFGELSAIWQKKYRKNWPVCIL